MKSIMKNESSNFYVFILGQFVSEFGSKLTGYGLILWSYARSGSVLSMSLLSVCYLLPRVLFSFLAGSISDNWNKKKIMLVSDTIAAVFSLSIVIMLFTDSMRLEYLYVVNFMLGLTEAFQNPASDVALTLIVSKDNYMKTSGLRTFCSSFMGILAPVVSTSLYAICGLKVIVILDLSTFVFAFVTLAFLVRLQEPIRQTEDKRSLFEQCIFGIKYLIRRRNIFRLILFMAFVNLIAAIYNTNLAPMVLSRNDNNEIQLGIVSSMISIAGLVGSFLVTRISNQKKRIPLIINIMIFSFLICNGLLGIGRNYYVWSFAVFVGNLLIPVLVANTDYIMRTRIPYDLQGKIFAARNTLQYTSIPVGNLLGGILADKVFIPYIKRPSPLRDYWFLLVGDSKGSGIALLYLCIALIGVGGCLVFRRSKCFLSLDSEPTV
jgi:MFS transporter, DHA3 family, macrolide efflux protein